MIVYIPVINMYLLRIKNLTINKFISDICVMLKVLNLLRNTADLSGGNGFEQNSLNYANYTGTLILRLKFCGRDSLAVRVNTTTALYSEPDPIVSFFSLSVYTVFGSWLFGFRSSLRLSLPLPLSHQYILTIVNLLPRSCCYHSELYYRYKQTNAAVPDLISCQKVQCSFLTYLEQYVRF
jgi:hypothetical protein